MDFGQMNSKEDKEKGSKLNFIFLTYGKRIIKPKTQVTYSVHCSAFLVPLTYKLVKSNILIYK